jgi:hypothetical protein
MRAYNIRSASNEKWNIWQDCHLCGQTILKSAMANHLREVHSCAVEAKVSDSRKSLKRDFDKNYEDFDGLDYELKGYVTVSDDGMDGSKYCGFPARDYGSQFGSYPVHDDYGDESGPD